MSSPGLTGGPSPAGWEYVIPRPDGGAGPRACHGMTCSPPIKPARSGLPFPPTVTRRLTRIRACRFEMSIIERTVPENVEITLDIHPVLKRIYAARGITND